MRSVLLDRLGAHRTPRQMWCINGQKMGDDFRVFKRQTSSCRPPAAGCIGDISSSMLPPDPCGTISTSLSSTSRGVDGVPLGGSGGMLLGVLGGDAISPALGERRSCGESAIPPRFRRRNGAGACRRATAPPALISARARFGASFGRGPPDGRGGGVGAATTRGGTAGRRSDEPEPEPSIRCS